MRQETQAIKVSGKAISVGRDQGQSALLVGAVGTLLMAKAIISGGQAYGLGAGIGKMPGWFWIDCGLSAAFGLLVWALRSATAPAAAIGAVICLNILTRQNRPGVPAAGWQGTALLALFLLTFAATRFGRARKEAMGAAEPRSGRRAAQVVANLGVAGLCTAGSLPWLAACIAALAEATADTVSSEMGQALAGGRWGKTLLITTGRQVAAGTDGGVSVAGTLCGMAAALVVVLVSPFAHTGLPLRLTVFAAGCAGLLFDSVLGATLERRGWLGNDLVNFTSTLFAAAVAYAVAALL